MSKILIVEFNNDIDAESFVEAVRVGAWDSPSPDNVIGEAVMDYCTNDILGRKIYKVIPRG